MGGCALASHLSEHEAPSGVNTILDIINEWRRARFGPFFLRAHSIPLAATHLTHGSRLGTYFSVLHQKRFSKANNEPQ